MIKTTVPPPHLISLLLATLVLAGCGAPERRADEIFANPTDPSLYLSPICKGLRAQRRDMESALWLMQTESSFEANIETIRYHLRELPPGSLGTGWENIVGALKGRIQALSVVIAENDCD